MSRALWAPQYYQKVLALDPFAYFMQDEKAGTVAYDLVSGRVAGAQNGAHSAGVDHGQPGIGDGRTSIGYDGTADYTNVLSAALTAAFSGAAGSAMIWGTVNDWEDGTERRLLTLRADANNRVIIAKSNVNNTLRWAYQAGGTIELNDVAGHTETGAFCMILTWDAVADEVKAYFDGAQTGVTKTVLGIWVGSIAAAVIGAASTVPANPWSGNLSDCALFDRALTPAEVADLAVVV